MSTAVATLKALAVEGGAAAVDFVAHHVFEESGAGKGNDQADGTPHANESHKYTAEGVRDASASMQGGVGSEGTYIGEADDPNFAHGGDAAR
jgi:hypothetical protein